MSDQSILSNSISEHLDELSINDSPRSDIDSIQANVTADGHKLSNQLDIVDRQLTVDLNRITKTIVSPSHVKPKISVQVSPTIESCEGNAKLFPKPKSECRTVSKYAIRPKSECRTVSKNAIRPKSAAALTQENQQLNDILTPTLLALLRAGYDEKLLITSNIDHLLSKDPRAQKVGAYARSMKMLGIELPDERRNPSVRCGSSQSWFGTNAKLRTRLTHRSVSMNDVSRIIPQVNEPQKLRDISLDSHQRALLSQAIYEEWYFRKGKECKVKKNGEQPDKTSQKKHKYDENEVQKALKMWEEKKIEQHKQKKNKELTEKQKQQEEESKIMEKKRKAPAAFESWKQQKRDHFRKRRQQMEDKTREEEAKKREEHEKKREAASAYVEWVRQKKERIRKQMMKRDQERQEEMKKQQRDKKERKEEAQIVFKAWKSNKDKEAKQKEMSYVFEQEAAREKATRKILRSQEALEEYECWLDHVDTKPQTTPTQSNLLEYLKPPWCPGGSQVL